MRKHGKHRKYRSQQERIRDLALRVSIAIAASAAAKLAVVLITLIVGYYW